MKIPLCVSRFYVLLTIPSLPVLCLRWPILFQSHQKVLNCYPKAVVVWALSQSLRGISGKKGIVLPLGAANLHWRVFPFLALPGGQGAASPVYDTHLESNEHHQREPYSLTATIHRTSCCWHLQWLVLYRNRFVYRVVPLSTGLMWWIGHMSMSQVR